MPTFSQNLQHTLRHARASAGERREDSATLEHLLLALTADPDAAEVMRACGVDLGKLHDAITWFLPDPKDGVVAGGDGGPELCADVEALLQRAVAHVTSVARDVVTGADVLVEIFAEPTAHFLEEQGMTRYDAIMHIIHSLGKAAESSQPGGGPLEAASKETLEVAGRSPMFRVSLLNDDFTPMEFVVYVLEQMFDKDRETATQIMLHVHNHGTGECGIYPFAVADAKAKELRDFAREHQHPLRCVVEAVQSG
jgi:ATP-dependent Clp protease adapter protein ClpS